MSRLLVHVEGQTEEKFVNEVLSPHLYSAGYHAVSARLLGNARLRSQRGGIRPWPSAKGDILRHLKQDSARLITTMVDYYAMPVDEGVAWPGRAEACRLQTAAERAERVEGAILDEVAAEIGHRFDPNRFVPFVVMHEFEGLLFSECATLGRALGQPGLEGRLRQIREQFPTPEEINDSRDSAPSKRLQAIFPRYQKPLHGVQAAQEIGLRTIRGQCRHFDNWLKRLESLAGR